MTGNILSCLPGHGHGPEEAMAEQPGPGEVRISILGKGWRRPGVRAKGPGPKVCHPRKDADVRQACPHIRGEGVQEKKTLMDVSEAKRSTPDGRL